MLCIPCHVMPCHVTPCEPCWHCPAPQTTMPALGPAQPASSRIYSGCTCRSTSQVGWLPCAPGRLGGRAGRQVHLPAASTAVCFVLGKVLHPHACGPPCRPPWLINAESDCTAPGPSSVLADVSVSDFYADERVKLLYRLNACQLANRRSSLSGVKYKDMASIFAWDLISEPRRAATHCAFGVVLSC